VHELREHERVQLGYLAVLAHARIVKREAHFVICVGNKGYAASLELRKVYQVLPDKAGLRHHQIRVIDESGEDYLYPEEYFVPVRLPQAVVRAVRRATA